MEEDEIVSKLAAAPKEEETNTEQPVSNNAGQIWFNNASQMNAIRGILLYSDRASSEKNIHFVKCFNSFQAVVDYHHAHKAQHPDQSRHYWHVYAPNNNNNNNNKDGGLIWNCISSSHMTSTLVTEEYKQTLQSTYYISNIKHLIRLHFNLQKTIRNQENAKTKKGTAKKGAGIHSSNLFNLLDEQEE